MRRRACGRGTLGLRSGGSLRGCELLRLRRYRWRGALRWGGRARERVDTAQRARDGLERRRHRRVLGRLSLELSERALKASERGLNRWAELCPARPLDLVQRSHRLRDRSRKIKQVAWRVGVPLERIKAPRERLSCITRKRDDVGHGLLLLFVRSNRICAIES